jgi:hypothetical protein
MTKQGRFYGFVKGSVHLDSPEVYKLFVKNFEGKRVEITIKEEGKDITEEQWGYLFGVVYPAIALETGYTIDEVDGVCKKRHLTVNRGTKKEYVKDKSRMTRKEIAEYTDLVIQDAAKIGVIVPPPNKNWKEKT